MGSHARLDLTCQQSWEVESEAGIRDARGVLGFSREEGLQAGSPWGPRDWRLAILWDEGSEAGSPPGGGIAGWESASWSLGLRILEGFGGRSDSGESRESWEEGLRDGILGGGLGGLES